MHSVGENGNSSSVPAFLVKLWKLVDERTTDDLIKWNSSGLSFTIRDQARFARELLPLYYKHNNMASFIRQLNMYGFHKVVSVDAGALKSERDEMEFAHTYFLRGHEYLLEHIKRKIPLSKQQEETKMKPETVSKVLCEVRSMKGKQDSLDARLVGLKRENESLWREVASLRQKHLKQQQIVNKLIQFLITVVQPSNGHAGLGPKRKTPLMLEEVAHSAKEAELLARREEIAAKKTESFHSRHKDTDFSQAPTLSSQTPGGPIIHDVTDLIDDPGNDGVVEVPIDDEDDISYMTTTTTPSVVAEEPDSFEVSNVTDPSRRQPGREDLDNQLDSIQTDLDNLREFFSLQTDTVDTSALFGVFGAAGSNLTLPQQIPNGMSMENGIGNEVMSYNPSFFELAAEDSHFLSNDTAGSSSAELESSIDEFLSVQTPLNVHEPALKKRKR